MNAHAIAATTTREPDGDGWPSTEEWVAHTAAVTLAWSALEAVIRPEVEDR